MAETNSAVKFYRTTSSAFSSATKEDGALYFLTDVGKIYLVVGTGSSQTLYQMSVSPSDIVSNVAQGDGNGQIKVTKNGSASNVSVKGLKSAAYTESTDYATSGHTHDTRYVRFDTNSQGLSSTQKSNARTNIGAGTGTYTKPSGGIPATDLASGLISGSGSVIVTRDTSTGKYTVSGSSGGSTLYRHNIEMVIKNGTSTSGYFYYHCYFYIINASNTAITHSTFYGSYGENYMKYPIQGGYVYDNNEDRIYGRSMSWLPRFSRGGDQRELLIAVRDVYDSVSESYISAASAYEWTDTVETLS